MLAGLTFERYAERGYRRRGLKLVLLYRFSSGYMRVLVVGCDYILFLFGGGDFFFLLSFDGHCN